MRVVPSRPAQSGAEAINDLFVSHDPGVVHDVSDHIAMLHRGRIVELGKAEQVSTKPAHRYTRRLQMATPVADPKKQRERRAERLKLLALDMSSVGTSSN
jgi:peptide/nickel transport system ATP-binding protein